jgi:hypothetical protein
MEKLEPIQINSVSKDMIDYVVYINNKMFEKFLQISTSDCDQLKILPTLYRKIKYKYNIERISKRFNDKVLQVYTNFTEASKNTKVPRYISRDDLIILSIFYMFYDIDLYIDMTTEDYNEEVDILIINKTRNYIQDNDNIGQLFISLYKQAKTKGISVLSTRDDIKKFFNANYDKKIIYKAKYMKYLKKYLQCEAM